MATYTYSTDIYTLVDGQKQHAYTLTGEVEAYNYNAAQSQASYDVQVQRIQADAQTRERTHVDAIHVEQK